MRTYSRNSPQAAARIVALAVIADGNVCRSEIETLTQLKLERELGLPAGGFAQVMHTLCEDLLQCSFGGSALTDGVDLPLLADLLDEVDEPSLQRTVLRLVEAAVAADRHFADGEVQVVATARERWSLGGADTPDAARQADLQPA